MPGPRSLGRCPQRGSTPSAAAPDPHQTSLPGLCPSRRASLAGLFESGLDLGDHARREVREFESGLELGYRPFHVTEAIHGDEAEVQRCLGRGRGVPPTPPDIKTPPPPL